ncbi:hypothetical protein ACETKC_06735 [Brevundimonas intermedia]|uniref:hypothetical protein n=1 Tax=Brevundimonas intermedia TaxID=74315 RepID=UPI0035A5ED41
MRRPPLRLVEQPPAERRWSGRRSVVVMIGLGALLWVLVAAAGWLLARAFT